MNICCSLVTSFKAAMEIAASSIRTDFSERFEYIFETIEIQEKQVRARPVLEEVPTELMMKVEDIAAIPTKHKVKHYSDLFSPAETTVECFDINQHLLVLGGWDGCVSSYTRKNNEFQF